jgi:peptidoglycan/xylan/chitin deacetylase (PgdA/CDA1 family)
MASETAKRSRSRSLIASSSENEPLDRSPREQRGHTVQVTTPIRAALTFDTEHHDRPNAGRPELVLDALAKAGIRATFFLQGRWVESEPSVARAIVAGGHLVGSHGFYHARMSYMTDDGIRHDISRAEEAIRDHAGVDPRPWFRLPFGDGASNERVLAGISAAGYRHVGWHVDTQDWQETLTSEELERCIRQGVRDAGDGAVVLLHGWPAATPWAVERVLAAASDDAVRYVRIDELGVPPIAILP